MIFTFKVVTPFVAMLPGGVQKQYQFQDMIRADYLADGRILDTDRGFPMVPENLVLTLSAPIQYTNLVNYLDVPIRVIIPDWWFQQLKIERLAFVPKTANVPTTAQPTVSTAQTVSTPQATTTPTAQPENSIKTTIKNLKMSKYRVIDAFSSTDETRSTTREFKEGEIVTGAPSQLMPDTLVNVDGYEVPKEYLEPYKSNTLVLAGLGIAFLIVAFLAFKYLSK